MTTRVHTAVSGQQIEYEPSAKVAAFLRRLEDAIHDSKITGRELTGLAFSSENPILDHTFMPGRASVTKDVLADPAYQVMSDLLFRKQIAEDGTDVDKLASRFSATVAEAAAELGIHESAVRQAIAARRIASWVKDGRHYLDPKALKSFELAPRGRKAAAGKSVPEQGPPLDVVVGHGGGRTLKIKTAEPLRDVERLEGNRHHGRLVSWKRIVVMTIGDDGGQRAFLLEPGPDENEIAHSPYAVRGHFVIRQKANSARAARALWDETTVA